MGHIPHLYLSGPWAGEVLALSSEHRHHLERVLRRSAGSTVSYTDGSGIMGEGRLGEHGVERGNEHTVIRASGLTLAVAPPRSTDRARIVVEKLQELAVPHLVWLATTHGEGRPPPPAKFHRWAVSALEQSRGAFLMTVEFRPGLDSLGRPLVVADLGGSAMPAVDHLTVAIGPEGGWSDDEVPADVGRVGLGSTVLRTETAAVAAAAVAQTNPALRSGD